MIFAFGSIFLDFRRSNKMVSIKINKTLGCTLGYTWGCLIYIHFLKFHITYLKLEKNKISRLTVFLDWSIRIDPTSNHVQAIWDDTIKLKIFISRFNTRTIATLFSPIRNYEKFTLIRSDTIRVEHNSSKMQSDTIFD